MQLVKETVMSNKELNRGGGGNLSRLALGAVLWVAAGALLAQQEADDVVEEVVVTGTHIKGANIAEALAISVLDAETIESLAADSGAELLDFLVESGHNYFNEAENISGGVNSARGDIGAFNLRNLGTGNTLVLLNGRRLVNAASYQTEQVGGDFVPVNTVNSQVLPVSSLQRVEILRDGASALYGADAVAGVVNYVLKTDFEGLRIRAKLREHDHIPGSNQSLGLEYGTNFNGGQTRLSIFANYYARDPVSAQDEFHWSSGDLRNLVGADNPFRGEFRNNSSNSEYRQYDFVTRIGIATPDLTMGASQATPTALGLIPASGLTYTDTAGEFETYPTGDSRCSYDINDNLCAAADGGGLIRYNWNEARNIFSDLERLNVYMTLNHDFGNGVESYTEFSAYMSETTTSIHASAPFSSVKLRVAANNYYNPYGPCYLSADGLSVVSTGTTVNPNRLAGLPASVPCTGLELEIDNGRFAEAPRIVDNDGETYRFLHSFTGSYRDWDWDTALIWSLAKKEDVSHNRVSNTLIQEALSDNTAAAYNPFNGRVDTNIERALVDVFRKSETDLFLIDFRVTNPDVFVLPAGPVGVFAGFEFRQESFDDDRDPRLDGTIAFTDFQNDTFPFVSDVVNSSPTPDNDGDRDVASLFGELQVPILEGLDMQLALRFEDFSDVGSTTVGKLAVGYRPHSMVLLRGSWSDAFRAPNLITINETIVSRINSRTDYVCEYVNDLRDESDTAQVAVEGDDCSYQFQRSAQGSEDLEPEESENTSFGIVLEPVTGLTLTLDFWTIEKENTIGLFGQENHTLLDLVQRLQHGATSCDDYSYAPVSRDEITTEAGELATFANAGICPAGAVTRISDRYANLNTRTLEGYDLGAYYDLDTDFGDFKLSLQLSHLDEFEQKAGSSTERILSAQGEEPGDIPVGYPVVGLGDLVRQDGNPEDKMLFQLRWKKAPWGARFSATRISDFIDTRLNLDDGREWVVDEMETYNIAVDYTIQTPVKTRVRVGINNVTDERAPLANGYFGYFSDVHRDLGITYYVSVQSDF